MRNDSDQSAQWQVAALLSGERELPSGQMLPMLGGADQYEQVRKAMALPQLTGKVCLHSLLALFFGDIEHQTF